MTELGVVSYTLSACAYFVLAAILAKHFKQKANGLVLVIAILSSFIWAIVSAYFAGDKPGELHSLALEGVSIVRLIAWLVFLQLMLLAGTSNTGVHRLLSWIYYTANFYFVLVAVAFFYFLIQPSAFVSDQVLSYRAINHLIMSSLGLFLVEQTLRHIDPEQRWSVKYLCFGLGGLFTYEFYFAANTLLLSQIDADIWIARGFVNALIAPFFAVFIVRRTGTSFRFFISHTTALHTTALLAGGLYLLAMGLGGYYIKMYGGTWGGMLQVVFLFGAATILATLLYSGSIRSSVKVFLGKHFFHYRYDYRVEWLNLTEKLTQQQEPEQLQRNALWAIADIVESPAGMLWLLHEDKYNPVVNLTKLDKEFDPMPADMSLIQYLQQTQWIVDIGEYNLHPDVYKNLQLPDWIAEVPEVWLVVPLMHQTQLSGFVILTHPRAKYQLNWEVRDILRTAGRQVASYLALLEVNAALAAARQFEAYNRLAAFVVHDLKNIVAQLTLIGRNAEMHKNNPEFIDDALTTVENATLKMNRLLAQLRIQSSIKNQIIKVSLSSIIEEAVDHRSMSEPKPEFEQPHPDIMISTDKDRLTSVLEHLIQNAQEATNNDGFVRIRLYTENKQIKIEISDNGCGMEPIFIREKLFKPFATTKGNAGMGIGVYEAREFLRSLGGRIDVQSNVGTGTTFFLSLPEVAGVNTGFVSQAQ